MTEPENTMTTPTDIALLDSIRKELAGVDEATADTEIKPASEFSALGVDSIALIELVSALEDEWDVEFANGSIRSMKTIGDLLGALRELVAA